MGLFDKRFSNGDGFLIVASGVSSLVAGPLILYYVYCIVEGLSTRLVFLSNPIIYKILM